MPPTVSVVIPVQNGEETLEAAVESVLAQDFPDFDVILVDHKSTDRTPEILASMSRAHPQVKTYSCEGTFVEAANLCWEMAEAPLIARMDADDLCRPSRLRKQKEFLDQHPDYCACGALVEIVKRNADGSLGDPDAGYQKYQQWINSVVTPEEIRDQRFVDSPIPNPTALIRRSTLEEIGGYHDPAWAEDYDFWLRILEKGWQIGKVDEILLDWIDAPDRSTRNLERYTLPQFQAAKAHFLSRLEAVRERGIIIAGAGPIGKEFAQLLKQCNTAIHAFLEVNPRQIGNRIHDIPVLGSEAMENARGQAVVLGASASDGARDRIRDLATKAGLIEGIDFFSIA